MCLNIADDDNLACLMVKISSLGSRDGCLKALRALLAFVTGLVNQELLLQNEYLAAENRILRCHLPTRLGLCDAERRTLAEIG
jgi:hypothetical protein